MGQTIACANQKGGVGKTTTVVNLAAYLALAGKRILLIDLDPQGNATSGLGIDRARIDRSVYDAFVEATPLAELTVPTAIEGLVLVPSAIGLAGAEVELAPIPQRERRLARLVGDVAADYDYVFFDCPPSLGLLTVNALTAADSVLVPLQCEYYALEGLTHLIATLNLVRDHLNPRLEVEGIVLTMYDGRTNLSADVAAEVRRHFGTKVFATVVPRSVRLSEAPSFGLPICLYRPDSAGALAYRALALEFLARDGAPPSATEASPPNEGRARLEPMTTGTATSGAPGDAAATRVDAPERGAGDRLAATTRSTAPTPPNPPTGSATVAAGLRVLPAAGVQRIGDPAPIASGSESGTSSGGRP